VQVRKAKAKARPYRLNDGDGLALWVSTTGSRSWQLRYQYQGKEQIATLGKADSVSLAEARTRAEEARRKVEGGDHLTTLKRVTKLRKQAQTADVFGGLATKWIKAEAKRAKWSDDYREEVESSITNHLAALDKIPVSEIDAPMVIAVLRRVENRPDMHGKVLQRLRGIFDYGLGLGVIKGNPIPATKRRARGERKHYPVVVDRAGVGEILRAARAADPCKGIQRAHLLLINSALRISEVVGAKWDEFDLQAATWSVPRSRMKVSDESRGPHIVPVPPRLLDELRQWRKVDGPDSVFVCPAPRNGKTHITREAVEKFYRRTLNLANRHSPHSWRSVFKSWCADAGQSADAVEAQLDHIVGSKTESAYDRAKRLERRQKLMAWYEGQLDRCA
jgi:integrase